MAVRSGEGGSIAGRLLRRLSGNVHRVERCAVCQRPVVVDRHCVRRDDGYLHAQCALYRRRPATAA